MLVTVAELASHLGSPGWLVVDCRFNLSSPEAGATAYQAAHIPGAFYAHLDRDLASPRTADSGRHPLPDPQQLGELFGSWGVEPDTRVIGYDDAGGAIAARLWWLLRWLGHEQAGLLDGGLQAWNAAGLPLSTATPVARGVSFTARPGQMPTVTTRDLAGRLGDPDLVILDARARNRFLGREEPIDPVAGHLPGAVSAPYGENLGPAGEFLSPAALRQHFAEFLGGRPAAAVVSMCGSGVTACHNLFAMELAGLDGGCLYAGSWSEWIRSADRPVARS